jgi:hypothetical protein
LVPIAIFSWLSLLELHLTSDPGSGQYSKSIISSMLRTRSAIPPAIAGVARELTKKLEEFRRATVSELLAHSEARSTKGEIVLVISSK